MASNYPTSLDNFTNPTSNDSLNSPSHSLQHANINDAVEAIEAKLGIGASTAGSATSGQVLTAGTGGTTTWQTLTPSGLTKVQTFTLSGSSGQVVTGLTAGSRYKLIYNLYGSVASENVALRFRESSTDKTTGYWGGSYYVAGSGTSGIYVNASNAIYITLFRITNSVDEQAFGSLDIWVNSNQNSASISGTTMVSYLRNSIYLNFENTTMATCDGFNIYPISGTLTGTMTLYKYQD